MLISKKYLYYRKSIFLLKNVDINTLPGTFYFPMQLNSKKRNLGPKSTPMVTPLVLCTGKTTVERQ